MKILITVIILILEGIESIYGILQLSGTTPALHPDYPATGHFYNPGPYGCFLAIAFPLALRWATVPGNELQKWMGTGMVIMLAILIPVTFSRTALAACLIGGVVALSDKTAARMHSAGRPRLIIALLAVTAFATGAYFMKKDSADGRLLMWKVAAEAAMEVPATGVGWDRVGGAYGEAQERYFSSGRGSGQEMMVADAPEYVFNEYLQVAIAFGIIAAIGVVALLSGGLITALRSREYGYAGSVAAVAMVMMASYPLQFPLFVGAVGLVLAGCYLSSKMVMIRAFGTIAVAGACVLFLTHDETVDVRSGFSIGHSLHRMGEYGKSNENLLALLPHSSDPMILNIIGKNYRSLGMADSAEYYLMKSVNRCPNRLYPHYLLMQLYADSGSLNREAMVREAEILVTGKEKISSPAVEEMRNEAREIIESVSK